MEDTLGALQVLIKYIHYIVLILVLMEDTLGVGGSLYLSGTGITS